MVSGRGPFHPPRGFVADELVRPGDDFLGKTGGRASHDDNAFPFVALHWLLGPFRAPRAPAYADANDALPAIGGAHPHTLCLRRRPPRVVTVG
jgi:hypothetical protein